MNLVLFCFVSLLHNASVNSQPAQENLPVLAHLLIVRLTDGVGVNLWKKQKDIIF